MSAAVAGALKVLRTEGGLTRALVSPVGEIASNNLVKHRKVCPNTHFYIFCSTDLSVSSMEILNHKYTSTHNDYVQNQLTYFNINQ